MTTDLRRLEAAGFVEITQGLQDSKPRTWLWTTPEGRRAFAGYLANLERALKWRPPR